MKKRMNLRTGKFSTALVPAGIVGSAAIAGMMALTPVETVQAASNAALERRLEQMEAELESLRSELSRTKADQSTIIHQQVRNEVATSVGRVNRNTLFFRGGYAQLTNGDRANQVFTDTFGRDNGFTQNDQNDGWYVGAGIDFNLTDDTWGLLPGVQIDGELAFDWKRWNSRSGVAVVPAAATTLGSTTPGTVTNLNPNGNSLTGVTLSQFTLSASPKIRFNTGTPLTPWLIPAGLAFNVVSPPSNAGTVLTPGVLFGAGVDYALWKAIKVGIDGRYMLSADEVDGVRASHFQVGGNIGIGF